MSVLGLWDYFVPTIWKSLVLSGRKVLACWKQSLMCHSDGNLEDKKSQEKQTVVACAHEVSERKLGCGHSCDILVKNLVSFCPCLENLSEIEFKHNGLIS